MKKTVCSIIFVLSLLFAMSASAEDVIVNGRQIAFSAETGIPYVNSDYRTMVPVRVVTENLGANVLWSEAEEKATIITSKHIVEVFVGRDYLLVDGKIKKMDTVAIEQGGRIYLPIRYVAEEIGCKVIWFEYKEKVIVMDSSYYEKYTKFRDMFTYTASMPEHSEFAIVNATISKKMDYADIKAYWNGIEKEDKEFFAFLATVDYHEANPDHQVSIAYIYKDYLGKAYYLATGSTFSYDVYCFEPFEK